MDSIIQFQQAHSDRLSREDRDSLQRSVSDLRMRYDRLFDQSESRVEHLSSGLEYLKKFDKEIANIEHWLSRTHDTIEGLYRDAGKDINVLNKQSNQVQSLMTDINSHRDQLNGISSEGQSFLNHGKVSSIADI